MRRSGASGPGSGSNPVRVVGIAGPSGSGKTTLARAVAERSGGIVFALDAYYRDQRDLDEAVVEVDVPSAIEVGLAVDQLRRLIEGLPIDQPVYDFATHARTPATRPLGPAPVVLVEGLFALYWPELRALASTRVFVTLDHDECLRRRIDRDMRERGRSAVEIEERYRRSVRLMYERYVAGTRGHANLVLDGRTPVPELTRAVLDALASHASPDEGQREVRE